MNMMVGVGEISLPKTYTFMTISGSSNQRQLKLINIYNLHISL